MIREKLVFGVCDTRVKERMLRESDLTLQKALDLMRAAESTRAQMKEMVSKESTGIDQIKASEIGRSGRTQETAEKRTCYKCGEVGHISPNCNNTGDWNHNRKGKMRVRIGLHAIIVVELVTFRVIVQMGMTIHKASIQQEGVGNHHVSEEIILVVLQFMMWKRKMGLQIICRSSSHFLCMQFVST